METENKSISLQNDFYTRSEIFSQPDLWLNVYNKYCNVKDKLSLFLEKLSNDKNIRIILTGAGSSAFIGEALAGAYSSRFANPVLAAATTDLITHPELYFNKNNTYLLISFARSGDSPESSQAIVLAETLAQSVSHLIITCNEQSELLETAASRDKFVFLLPPEANDKGLAMTASFTSMLLAGLLISRFRCPDKELKEQLLILQRYSRKILKEYSRVIQKAASFDFNRAVFLGSGMLKGIARESHLKLQELTDGNVICKYDSFMGFRHGPKAVLNEDTLIVYLFSNNSYAGLYEKDLVSAITESWKSLLSIGIMEDDIPDIDVDLKIILSEDGEHIHEDFLTVISVVPAQLLGLFKSINLGLNPDSPSESGKIHRVVQGVNIYPYFNENNDC
jgi:tagatose-6-phosphate ketose/aldose isomerase